MSLNLMDTQTSTDATSGLKAKPKPRRRLNSTGVVILEDEWDKHPGEFPSLDIRKSLTAQIKRTPGNDFYKVINTTEWFKRRIQRNPQATLSIIDPRFPSLTSSSLKILNVLLEAQQKPSPELITTWANLLASSGATYQDVVAWVHTGLRTSQLDHLPTPDTVTPEPSLSPSSPAQAHNIVEMKKDPTHSPVLPPISVQPPQYEGQPQFRHYRSSLVSPLSPVSPMATGASIAQDQRPRLPALEAIFQGVADAVATPTTPPDALPSSAAEFNAMFAPYEKQLSQLILTLENS